MKKMIVANILCILSIVAFSHPLQNNSDTPAIHKMCPDFYFSEMHQYTKSTARISDFHGKWLVIYAWSMGCSACAASFPKVNDMQKKYSEQATFLLVGDEHPEIRKMYEPFRIKQHLTVPIAFDSLFFRQFNIRFVPHVIIINPEGIIRAITSSGDETLDGLKKLFAGEMVDFETKDDLREFVPLNTHKPMFLNGNGGPDSIYLFRSIFTPWNKTQEHDISDFEKKYNWSNYCKNGIQLSGVWIDMLYRIAYVGPMRIDAGDSYYGNFYQHVLWETRDSLAGKYDHKTGKNIFNYSLLVPDSLATNAFLQMIMRRDVEMYLPFKATIETRRMPVWEMVCTGKNIESLSTKHPECQTPNRYYPTGVLMCNRPLSDLIYLIFGYHQFDPPFIDKTGMTKNVDMDFNAIMTDLKDVDRELNRFGLRLKKSSKLMKVLVIRDGDQRK